jgi:hypothetical protein
MIPALESGFMVTAGSRWEIATMRPGLFPIRSLAEALMKLEVFGAQRTDEHAAAFLEDSLRCGPRGLIDSVLATPLPKDTNLLLIVDQFEELFRFRNGKNCDEQDAFTALLLESVAETGMSIYVVLTMRSDYLSDCAIFRGLPEALNRSQYLTPRLTRDQREAAITGPARVFGGDVEPSLLNRLLNETGNDPNQLPVLQHLLMRMWATTNPLKPIIPDNPFYYGIPEENLGHVLTLADYEEVGGIAGALSRHADQAYDSLSDSQKKIAEVLFRTICERGSAHRDGRHPSPVATIAERAGVPSKTIIEVVDIFRNPSYGFLVPPHPQKLCEDSIIDISHESLIKLWKRLSVWVEEEANAAETYDFLEKSAKRWKDGLAALWNTPYLENAIAWKEREHPTSEWAERYGGNFQLAMEFLEASQEKQRVEEAEKEALRQNQLRKTRQLLKISISAIIGGIILIALYAYMFVIPYESYSRNFTKRWGVIYPVGPLEPSAIAHRSWSLKLTRNGRLNPVQSVEAIDSNGKKTPYHSISTYLSDADKAEQEEKPVRYEFVYDRQGKVVYEIGWDRFRRRSWTLVHIPSGQMTETSKNAFFGITADKILSFLQISSKQKEITARGFFVDAEGFPKPQGHSLAEIVEIQYDDRGFETRLTYFDRTGKPQPGLDNAYGVELTYDDQGREIRRTSLNEKGVPVNDDAGNAGLLKKYDNEGNLVEASAFDANGMPTLVKSGWHLVKLNYDKWGNEKERRYFSLSGEPIIETEENKAHKITQDYDNKGNITSIKFFGSSEEPIVTNINLINFSAIPVHEKRYTYDSDNKILSESYYDSSGQPATSEEGLHQWKYEYDHNDFLCAVSSLDIKKALVQSSHGFVRTEWVNDTFGRKIEERYFSSGHKPASNSDGYHCKRYVYDRAGNTIKEAWFDVHNRPVSHRSHGVPCIIRTYDVFRHCLTEQLCDPSGRPINGPQQFSLTSYRYSDLGSLRATQWFDNKENPCNGPTGIHRIRYQYGADQTLKTKEERFDVNRNPAVGRDGIHEIRYEYNDKRQQTKYQCFGLNGKPVEDKDGDHLVVSQFDEKGRQTGYGKFRADGSANLDRLLGVASWTKVYNNNNQWTEHAYYDANRHLVIGLHGYAKGSIDYSPDGGVTLYSHGMDGKLNFNTIYGCAIKQDTSLKLAYYGPDRILINGPYGFAEQRLQKDKQGNLLSAAWFGADGKPVVGVLGFHRIDQTPDGRTKRYFDTENRPVTAADKYPLAPIMFIEQILDVKQPAYKIGLCTGDVIWKYGRWSYPSVLNAARTAGIQEDKIQGVAFQLFRNEISRNCRELVSMTVLRNGQPIEIRIPPLPAKALGIARGYRMIPAAQFEQWEKTTL